MTAQTKKRGATENGDGVGLGLAAFIANNEDVGPIEEICRLHYEEFILALDELFEIYSVNSNVGEALATSYGKAFNETAKDIGQIREFAHATQFGLANFYITTLR
ncbi:hypothetical protein ACJX0J_023900 [Zea mays]